MAADMNDPVYQQILAALVKLLFEHPFFGTLASRLDPVDATKWCKSIATDGRRLYYNREFIKSLSPEQVVWVVSHTVLHLVYDHLGRRGSKNKQLWDMANDYNVNYTLRHELVNTKKAEEIAGALYSDKWTDELTSEEIYRQLEENSTTVEVGFDEHLDLLGEGEDGAGSSVSVTVVGDENGPPQLTDADIQTIKNEVKSAVINAAQAMGAGRIPAGVRRLIEGLTNPIMDWRTLLEMHIQSSIKDDFTFQRPSKRSWPLGIIIPGQNFKDTVDVAITIDTSGSMTDEMLKDFLGEVKGIMETFDDFKLTLWTFDTKVYNPKVFNPSNLDEIMDYDAQGGGGTMFECNWEFMKDPESCGFEGFNEPIEPHKFVMFTDGYPCGTWGDEEYCDTLFVVHSDTNIEAPFGLTAYYVNSK